jgi:hypothetical protein
VDAELTEAVEEEGEPEFIAEVEFDTEVDEETIIDPDADSTDDE